MKHLCMTAFFISALLTPIATAATPSSEVNSSGQNRVALTPQDIEKALAVNDANTVAKLIMQAVEANNRDALPVIRRAFESQNVWIRRAAIRAIMIIDSEASIEYISRALVDTNPLVRLDATMLAGRIKVTANRTRLINLLDDALSDAQSGIRTAAALSLGQLGDTSVTDSLVGVAVMDKNVDVRGAAISALGRLPDKKIPMHLQKLLAEDEDRMIRAEAAYALGFQVAPGAEDALFSAIQTDAAAIVRLRALNALGRIGTERAKEHIQKCLESEDEDFRITSVRVLANMQNNSKKNITALLGDAHPDIRAEAIMLLANSDQTDKATDIAMLIADSEPRVRAAAVEALGMLGSSVGIPAVERTLTDKNPEVRALAAEAAGRLGAVGVIDVLIKMASQNVEDGEVIRAITALGLLGHKAARPVLIKCLDSNSMKIRRAAAGALGHLGGAGTELFAARGRFDNKNWSELLVSLSLSPTKQMQPFFQTLSQDQEKPPEWRFASYAGLYLLGDNTHKELMLAAAQGQVRGANQLLALAVLIQKNDNDGIKLVRSFASAQDSRAREVAIHALLITLPQWGESLLTSATKDSSPTVARRARVGLNRFRQKYGR